MDPRISICFLVSWLLTVVSVVISAGENGVRFSYKGSTGPEHWGQLSPTFSTCSTGKMQSPVDIRINQTFGSRRCKPLNIDYRTANATLIDTGIVLRVQFMGPPGALTIDGEKYWFKQMHWHTPSEHLINGHRFAAELHLVHQTDQKNYAVVSVLYKLGKEDPVLARIKYRIDHLGREKKCEQDNDVSQQIYIGNFTTRYFKRNIRRYYKYVGSLTTPPCSENVTFYIVREVREISLKQIECMESRLCPDCKKNARPVQPLNGRKVELCHEHRVRTTSL